MVEIELPDTMSDDFVRRVPAQRQMVNDLMERGTLISYALTTDRTKLWCVFKAESEIEVMTIMSDFPLIDFMSPTISELMFNNVVALRLPLFSLN